MATTRALLPQRKPQQPPCRTGQRWMFRAFLTVIVLAMLRMSVTRPTTVEQTQRGSMAREEQKSKQKPTNMHDSPLFHIVISTGDESISTLNMRCIESIFYFHPKARLQIHTPLERGISSELNEHPKLKLLHEYNIELVRYKPQDVLKQALKKAGSLVNKAQQQAAERFLTNLPKLKQEKYWYSNETNLLRMCLLYLYGGIYLDTDVILINNVLASDARIDNAMGRNHEKFHCAVMKFATPGNFFLAATLGNFLEHYNGTKWGNNGPLAFGRAAKQHPELVCPDDNFDYLHNNNNVASAPQKNKDDSSPSCWLNPLPNEAFAPVSWKRFGEVCFSDESPTGNDALEFLQHSYAVHLNNKATGKELRAKEYRKGTLCHHVLTEYCVVCQE